MIFISVLNWNNYSASAQCIASLYDLNFKDYEIILVDNASEDGSGEELVSKFGLKHYIKNEANLGFGRAHNRAVAYALARGASAVWILNNDTIVDPWCLSEMYKTLTSDSAIGCVGSVAQYPSGNIQTWGGGKVLNQLAKAQVFREKHPDQSLDYISGVSMLIDATAFASVGGFDETFFMYWEDVDLGVRLKAHGWALAVSIKASLVHETSGSLKKAGEVNRSVKFEYYLAESLVIYAFKHAWMPLLTIFLSLSVRISKQILLRRGPATLATLNGARAGLLGLRDGSHEQG